MKTNLSLFERLVRPLAGLMIATVALSQETLGLPEAILLVLALFLVLNGITARCYLWKWLGLNTAQNEFDLCNRTVRGDHNESG